MICDGGGGLGVAHEQSVAEPRRDFVAQVINFSAGFGVRGCAFFLQVLSVAVEDLEGGCAWGLDGIAAGLKETPSDGWMGKEGS